MIGNALKLPEVTQNKTMEEYKMEYDNNRYIMMKKLRASVLNTARMVISRDQCTSTVLVGVKLIAMEIPATD